MVGFLRLGPDARHVAIRAAILARVAAHAVSIPPRAQLQRMMAAWSEPERDEYALQARRRTQDQWAALASVQRKLTPLEREFFQTDALSATDRQQVDGSWRIESLQALLWALAILPALPPFDRVVDQDLTALAPLSGLKALKRMARLRPRAEIEAARAGAELWHWRSQAREQMEAGNDVPAALARQTGLRTYPELIRETARWAHDYGQLARVTDEDFEAFGKPYRALSDEEWSTVRYITIERHHALNWLCGRASRNRWHETPTEPAFALAEDMAAARKKSGKRADKPAKGKPAKGRRR